MKYQKFSFDYRIISSSRLVKILFLSFKCENIGVAVVTNMIGQLQESSCPGSLGRLFWNFIDKNVRYFQDSKIKFVSLSGHVILSMLVIGGSSPQTIRILEYYFVSLFRRILRMGSSKRCSPWRERSSTGCQNGNKTRRRRKFFSFKIELFTTISD